MSVTLLIVNYIFHEYIFCFLQLDIKTNATKSVRSKILNLCEENPDLTVSGLMTSIGWEYLRTHPLELIDNGMEYANQQNGFQLINPTENWFPGKDFL